MRHWLPPLAILAGLLAFCIWDASQMRQETLRWRDQLQQADQLAAAENWPAALAALEDSYQDWSTRRLYLHTVAPRDAVDDAEAMYLRAIAFAKTTEITEFRAELSDLRDQLRILEDLESCRLRSIL